MHRRHTLPGVIVDPMPRPASPRSLSRSLRRTLFLLLLALDVPHTLLADPPREAAAAFDAYARAAEQRLEDRLRTASDLPFPAPGTLHIENLHQAPDLPGGARLDHWRGVAFIPGATAAQFEALLRNVTAYPTTFAPQVLSARAQPDGPDRLVTTMRVRQHHVLTVVLDATYDVTFAHDPTAPAARGYSLSRSTRIAEIDSPGTRRERPLTPAEEHGFLWRLHTCWRWEERDGGLLIAIDTLSLSRAVPRGLHWIVGPYVDSIPRDSLAFTLTQARNALAASQPLRKNPS